ncbi:MAG TPA: hypothetical protein VGG19_06005 [Tepidisphaeraceae bacterium]|jgi:DNA-directed RNA polymerase subunit M/transcription elongation factor TFIIS
MDDQSIKRPRKRQMTRGTIIYRLPPVPECKNCHSAKLKRRRTVFREADGTGEEIVVCQNCGLAWDFYTIRD